MINAAWLCVLCLSIQDAPPTGGADGSSILSGPTVRDVDDARPSLVGGEFGGMTVSVLADPAFDALRLIKLDEAQQSKLGDIMAERWSQLDALVRSNYGLIVEFAAVATAQNQQELLALLPRVQETFKPYIDRGSVIEEMSSHLRKEQIAEAQRLTGEYAEARIEHFAAMTPNLPRRAHVVRMQLESFGQQIAESVERQVGLQQDQYEQFAEQLLLTPEQKQQIEAIYQPIAIERFLGKVDPKAEAEAMFKVWEILNAEQRKKLLLMQYGGGQDAQPDQVADAQNVRTKAAPYKASAGPFAVETTVFDWHDADRNRNIPARIYLPRTTGSTSDAPESGHPVIIFSHGLGGSRDASAYLGNHLASHGYVTVHVEHINSNTETARDHGLVRTLNRMPQQQEEWRNRARDVSFAIDQLERMNDDDAGDLHDMLDLDRIGVAGHSYGAYTSMVVVGALVDFPDEIDANLRDPRIKASMPMSPQWIGRLGLDENSWRVIEVPMLYMTGTEDAGAGGVDAARRTEPFDRGTGAEQYLMVVNGAQHSAFGDVRPQNRLRERQRDSRHHDWIRMTAVAFFDACLRGDKQAQAWLKAGTIAELSGGEVRFEQR